MLLTSFVFMSKIVGKVNDFRKDFPYFCENLKTNIFFSTLAARRFKSTLVGAMIKYPRALTAWVTSMILSINVPYLLYP